MSTRFTGGLAAAALLVGGLACQGGAASAADVTGYPQTLGFTAQHLVATDAAVFAAGVSDDSTAAYVGKVGSEPITLDTTGASSVYSVDITRSAGGLLAVVSTDVGYQRFVVDTATMTAEPADVPSDWSNVDALGTDSVDAFTVVRNADQAVVLDATGIGEAQLDSSGSGSAAGSTGAPEHRTWYVGGNHWSADGSTSEAMLWSYDEATHTTGTPVVIGPAGDPDESVLDVVADPATDTVYTLSFQDQVDAPQTYGISVVHDGTATYHPLTNPAQTLALSEDGQTVYVSEMSGVVALDAGHIVDDADSADDVRNTWIDDVNMIGDLATDPAGHLFAAADRSVVAFSAPGAPTGLDLSVDPDSPQWGGLTWTAPEATGGTSADYLAYEVTLTDKAGGEPWTNRYYGTDMYLDLVPGHSYDITVTTDNGLFRGDSATISYTPQPVMAHPSWISVDGRPRVGSRLTVANHGSWAKGATLSYRWLVDDRTVSRSSTLTVTPAMLGKQVTVSVTGALAGYSDHTQWSEPTAKITRGVLTAAKPQIAGTAKVGKTLTAKVGRWTAGTGFSYSWAANGKKIAGAARPTLKLARAQAGKRITVTVTGTKAGYAPTSKASGPTGTVAR